MAQRRFRRRKDARPGEITAAAAALFAEKGYAATRVDDVARRAGVSKGLMYLYFRTKEELLKSVIRSFIEPRIEALRQRIEEPELSAEEFLRGPFLQFIRALPNSPVHVIVKLMVTEGPRHPELVAYYWNNVVSLGLDTLRRLLQRGVDNGEFRSSALQEFPHLMIAPVLFAVLYSSLFGKHEKLDTDRMFAEHVGILIESLKRDPRRGDTG
ncbi:MAG: TetR/AcrR family transcriptional regulator [Gammaproteobacteria bacterium]|nr:TetR/AcrR family transcriptional regulator [Gammaproteobacteria bacterium]